VGLDPDTRIFSPVLALGLCATKCHDLNELKRLRVAALASISPSEYIAANSSGKVVAKWAVTHIASDDQRPL
jgi:hypothetical protein